MIRKGPTLDELNEEDRPEFPKDTTWTFNAEERERNRKYCWKNQCLPEAAALAAPPAGYQKFHQHQLRPELLKLKRVGLSKRKYTPMPRPKPEDVPLMIPNGIELAIVSSEDIMVQTNLKEYGQKSGEVLHTKKEINKRG